jgi:hypothetical protein
VSATFNHGVVGSKPTGLTTKSMAYVERQI